MQGLSLNLSDYGLFDRGVGECATEIVNYTQGENADCKFFCCLNPHSFVEAMERPRFRVALQGADWLVPDGVGIVVASRLLGGTIKGRVTGPDVFLEVMKRLDKVGGSVFFLGSSTEVLDRIETRANSEFPNLKVVGTYSPPYADAFSEAENLDMVSAINAARPDVLWVGMTAPKQECWIADHRHLLNVRVAGAIGAAFDFYAGTVKRSPKFFRSIGLEWLPRLLAQPRRLGRRMFVSAPIFMIEVLKVKFSKG